METLSNENEEPHNKIFAQLYMDNQNREIS